MQVTHASYLHINIIVDTHFSLSISIYVCMYIYRIGGIGQHGIHSNSGEHGAILLPRPAL